MKPSILFAIFSLTANIAMADSKWTGSGQVLTPDGHVVQGYQIVVENKDLGNNQIESHSTMTFDDGTAKTITQEITTNGNSWSDKSDAGNGGGACYQEICSNYLQGLNGQSEATTIVVDSDSSRRDVTYLLQNNRLVKVFKDKISKVQ